MLILSTITSFLFASEIVVYSARNEQLIQPIFQVYEEETGVKINYITGDPGVLIERLKAEGRRTSADILLTVDAGNLWYASRENLLEKVNSPILEKNIPTYLKDPNNRWFGFSKRARVIFYNPKTVDPSKITSYLDLANEEWKSKLCLRTSKKNYNMSLVATLIEKYGEKKTRDAVRGWVNNLALPVFPNDTKLIEAIEAGECQLGVANTYYFGRLQREREVKNVKILFLEDTHINISGAGLLKHAKNKDEAIKFLEWLSQEKAQKLFAGINFEYPVLSSVDLDPIVVKWGKLTESSIPLIKAGANQRAAVRIMERANYR